MTIKLSREDLALMQYLKDSGVPHRVTCTVIHSLLTAAGNASRHVAEGTDGIGLGIDAAGPERGRDLPGHLAVFEALLEVEHDLHELIYTPAGFSVKNGRRVPPIAAADHHDHVHMSVDRGVFIMWPGRPQEEPHPMNAPVFKVALTADDQGYYVFARDGGVFTFGNAPFHGSIPGLIADGVIAKLNAPIIDVAVADDDSGYVMLAEDGGIFTFGDMPFHGTAAAAV